MSEIVNIKLHLDNFVNTFVVSEKKDRWRVLLEKLINGKNISNKSNALENSITVLNGSIFEGEKSFPNNLISLVGDIEGVYFDFYSKPTYKQCSEVVEESFSNGFSVFIYNNGKKAVVFTNESLVYYCA